MQIESYMDKLLITEAELQELVKAAILAKTGRTVHGAVRFQQRKGEAKDYTGPDTSAWTYLESPT